MKKRFKYSKKVLFISLSSVLLMMGVTWYVYYVEAMFGAAGVVVVLCWFVFIATACFVPLYYVKCENGINLRLLCFSVNYPFSKYEMEIVELKENDMIRLFGSGGFLGYFGYFHQKKIGNFLLFCTAENKRYIKLTCKLNKKIVMIEEL